MKTLVVYESVYGNTRTVAQAIGGALPGEVQVVAVGAVQAGALEAADLLVIGAPTQGGRPTEATQALLDRIAAGALAGKKVAAFDTRLTARWVRIFGYAAPKIAAVLEEKGGTPAGEPGGFFVKGKKGPLVDGEMERAAAWAAEIGAAMPA